MLKWNDNYLIGVEIIDNQHKELFRIATSADDLLKNEFYTDKYDKIVEIINELKDYTVIHFKTEEKYMLDIGYKRFLSHKAKHTDFIQSVNKINLENVDEQQDEYIASIIEFAVNWIVEHIYENDKLIVS